ncbi:MULTISPECIES: NADH:ubiquinone oxidoreductase subunit NDUFA12 [Pseudovibrio]|uniref:NADH:ubiquinone oxidoreductase subunit NDUFA12 n=1 Tax=Stappiaceae TaxID=2821832 RepID=UPI00236659DA|nr:MULTISPECIES: NADH:ubiquinone oxidoreductase subunit NDUFA12 [Pseudovibrio]MDD7908870.1 NADH:ubiquinone oxidoreductase subunit NDUFA12 [Pseudovibrio exalbescens]MDX5593812.1 NADH:ubiquinone oxidoreductase subunit NDUFA12 [Pseudovibrio sp. SPO723]
MKQWVLELFTWWNSQTMGTRFFTWRKGEFVGEDEFGNKYYRERAGKRRWVLYNGTAEASRIPAGWHGWMHHRTDVPPTEDSYKPREWEAAYVPNMTGTPNAYRPKGSILTPESRPRVTGDYEAWSPGD